MAVRDELVETTIATNANGSAARKGIELSSRAAYVAVDWARHNLRTKHDDKHGLRSAVRNRSRRKCRDARGTRWLEDLLQDTRYALRTFRRKPGFTVVALLILSLGIGATTVMFA